MREISFKDIEPVLVEIFMPAWIVEGEEVIRWWHRGDCCHYVRYQYLIHSSPVIASEVIYVAFPMHDEDVKSRKDAAFLTILLSAIPLSGKLLFAFLATCSCTQRWGQILFRSSQVRHIDMVSNASKRCALHILRVSVPECVMIMSSNEVGRSLNKARSFSCSSTRRTQAG